jgi:hypothetical protein
VLAGELLVLLDESVDDCKVVFGQQHYILISTCRDTAQHNRSKGANTSFSTATVLNGVSSKPWQSPPALLPR